MANKFCYFDLQLANLKFFFGEINNLNNDTFLEKNLLQLTFVVWW